MKHNWEYKQLGDICSILMGQSPSSDSYNDESKGLPFFQGCSDFGKIYPSVTKFCSKPIRVAAEKDILFSVRAPIGTMNIANVPCCIGRGLCSFRIHAPNLQKYLFYALNVTKPKIIEKGTGSTFKAVNKDVLFRHIIPVPPMEVQEQIVAELDKINETIEDCRELLRILDALAQSLFYDFFGDPITNPKGWPIDKLGNLLIIERGGSPRPIKEYITQDEDGINWIKIGDANSSMYISSTKEKIKPSGKSKSRFVKPGDFILSNSMSFGRPYIMNTYGCIHDGWLLLRDNNNFFNKIYLYYCLNSKSIYSEFERLVRTGTVSNLNSDIVRGVKIPVPPLAHQEKFAERIEQIEAQKKAVEQTIAELQTLLDSRMDYWFN